jgi:hypothetical protein
MKFGGRVSAKFDVHCLRERVSSADLGAETTRSSPKVNEVDDAPSSFEIT